MRKGVIALVALTSALAVTGTASARTARLTLSTPSLPGSGHPLTVRERGYAAGGTNFVFVFLSPSATGCARTQSDERNRQQVNLIDSYTLPKGPFNHLSTGFAASPAPGLYRLCGYLNSIHGPSVNPEDGPPDATATLVLGQSPRRHKHRHKRHRRRPHAATASSGQGTLSLTLSPTAIRDGYPVTATASGTYTQWSVLYVEVQESADPCGSTFAAENNRIQDQTDPFDDSLINQEYGNPDLPATAPTLYSQSVHFLPDGPGPYRFCGYLEVSQPTQPGVGPTDPPVATSTALLTIDPNAVPQPAPLPGQPTGTRHHHRRHKKHHRKHRRRHRRHRHA